MTPEDVALVLRQGRRLRRLPEFTEAFYGAIFRLRPDLRHMFPDDLEGQRKRFVTEFDALIFEIDHLHELNSRAAKLGSRHHSYGVQPDHYGSVGEALLEALQVVLAEEWDEYSEQAWSGAFGLVADAMQDQPPGAH